MFEFHISRAARDRARFDEALFHTSGRVVLARPAAARRLAARWTEVRGGSPVASAADVYALGLLDEVAHVAMAAYRAQHDAAAFSGALPWLAARLGTLELDRVLLTFVEQFPPLAVYRGEMEPMVWLAGDSAGTPHRALALEELLALWLTHANDAAAPYRDLFESPPLTHGTAFARLPMLLRAWFESRPRLGPEALPLIDFLRAPALASPHSLQEQLAWMREHWSWLLGDLIERLLTAFDLRQEEDAWWAAHAAGAGWTSHAGDSSAAAVPRYDTADHEYEQFSADAEWMPNTVMIAKSTYVWLDQLARHYHRPITRLDEVPDEELDTLAAFGVNALWLIGLWQRSQASQEIKRRMGQPDAAASAYSLDDYAIAADLGGEEAYRTLRDRAAARGIRLASDMVPNHMGLDSRWLIEHPEWFLSLDHSPYPSYTFDGPDLSHDGRMTIQLEDHYYDRTDAAVVFRTIDHRTGEHRFVYHGNDGTSFPWNDTAQLDYSHPGTREQVIQTIVAVARRFPIIRFDAAMTLARRHIRRLWFPEPGAGGAIPSRAGHGMTQREFDRAIPHEFWREVVDRIAVEAPGTLLLAEAFWMMEGYFVRTLGMHRVYNSAFMNMLRDEQNAHYRSVIKNTLEFDPDVLQRYVNFLNNPDEKTAVEQFGRGEKYWGACLLMATLPGLPMFGHGQLQGFDEKYGMEFRRAQRDEPVDEGLWAEHWRRISPVLQRRWLFAGSREFLLYDCFGDHGVVNEDVYAYSNRAGDNAALVLFHNRHTEAGGWIRVSAAYADKQGGRALRQRSLAEGLGLPAGDALVRCRELVSGHEHLFRAEALREQGMRVMLGPYGSRVFVDWRVVEEDARPWRELERRLAHSGTPDLEAALWQAAIEPAQRAFSDLLAEAAADSPGRAALIADHAAHFTTLVAPLLSRPAVPEASAREHVRAALARLEAVRKRMARLKRSETHTWLPAAEHEAERDTLLAAHAALLAVASLLWPDTPEAGASELLDALRLRELVATAIGKRTRDPEAGWRAAARLRLAIVHPAASTSLAAWQALLIDPDARWLMGVDAAAGSPRVDREAFLMLAGWMELPALLGRVDERELSEEPDMGRSLTPAARLARWNKLATRAKDRLELIAAGPAT